MRSEAEDALAAAPQLDCPGFESSRVRPYGRLVAFHPAIRHTPPPLTNARSPFLASRSSRFWASSSARAPPALPSSGTSRPSSSSSSCPPRPWTPPTRGPSRERAQAVAPSGPPSGTSTSRRRAPSARATRPRALWASSERQTSSSSAVSAPFSSSPRDLVTTLPSTAPPDHVPLSLAPLPLHSRPRSSSHGAGPTASTETLQHGKGTSCRRTAHVAVLMSDPPLVAFPLSSSQIKIKGDIDRALKITALLNQERSRLFGVPPAPEPSASDSFAAGASSSSSETPVTPADWQREGNAQSNQDYGAGAPAPIPDRAKL